MPPVRITLPDGSMVTNEENNLDHILSQAFHREVSLNSIKQRQDNVKVQSEEYWPDMKELDFQDTVTDFDLPEGTFFDTAVVHLVTTATLGKLREMYPQGRFEARRFRPNIVIACTENKNDFPENEWIGHIICIGDDVRLQITQACAHCVMTTLAQGDLPADLGILRTAANANKANVGIYASVTHGGNIHRGDAIRLEKQKLN